MLAIFGARIGVDRVSLKEREVGAPMCYLGVNRSSVPGELRLVAAVDPEATSDGDVFEHAHRARATPLETGAGGRWHGHLLEAATPGRIFGRRRRKAAAGRKEVRG